MKVSREDTIEELLGDGWIRDIHWLDEINSTNLFAKELMQLEPTPSLPILVLADSQSEGRGRGSNAWWSPQGCLMLTLIWQPRQSIAAESIPQAALVVGMCVAETIDQFSSQQAKVKWPNDVYLDSRKVAGILIESIRSGVWAIGIGINIQTPIHLADEQLQKTATSLHYWSGRNISKEEFLVELCSQLKRGLDAWEHSPILDLGSWKQRCWLTDRVVTVEQSNGKITGLCEGIDEQGHLVIRTEDGRCRKILSGSVSVAAC